MKRIVEQALVFVAVMGASAMAFAQDTASSATVLMSNEVFAQQLALQDKGTSMIAAAIAICVAVVGGALGQGMAASKALDGIARNPAAADKIQTPMIIALALIESLVLFAFVIAFVKIG
ncbi:MAG: ATP synthase F0 subunit C [Pseudobdellovibrionaceae bacterium]|jgi:F-type H+-transporting ATPase subunit c